VCVLPPIGRDSQSCAERVRFPCGVSEMTHPSPDLVTADLAKLINPGLRSPRACLVALPAMAIVQAEIMRGTHSQADAIEAVVTRGLAAMNSSSAGEGVPPRLADPVKALRAALALRPGSERVKSKTRRTAAAHAMGLLSGDGWRAHHEKPLLRDLATVICSMDAASATARPNGLGQRAGAGAGAGIQRFYADFVDIDGEWDQLFAASSTLDLAIMYGATWRNTYRKNLCALAGRPGGRIRVVLPDASAESPLVPLYAHAVGVASGDFRRKVCEAIEDFRSMEPRRHVEVYATRALFRHAVYLFTHQAILALYALCAERIPTPALLASDGGLLSFMREDFDRLLEQSDRVS
jgi:hypothetical protein